MTDQNVISLYEHKVRVLKRQQSTPPSLDGNQRCVPGHVWGDLLGWAHFMTKRQVFLFGEYFSYYLKHGYLTAKQCDALRDIYDRSKEKAVSRH